MVGERVWGVVGGGGTLYGTWNINGGEEGLNASLRATQLGEHDLNENGRGIDFLLCSRRLMGRGVQGNVLESMGKEKHTQCTAWSMLRWEAETNASAPHYNPGGGEQ